MKTTSLLAALALTFATVAAAPASAAVAEALPRHSISTSYVSGVSSGGYMADQLHVAYSGTFKGAGIFSAGAYHCARGSVVTAQLACMNDLYDDNPAELERTARDRAAQGRIDPVANLSGHPVWIFHGTNDSTVKQSVNDGLAGFYGNFGAAVSYDKTSPAGHAWVSPIGPNPCSATYTPYINKCSGDPVGAMLGHLFGSVSAPASSPGGTLMEFDQNAYAPGGSASSISMDATGFAYIPAGCASASCRLMVALHGCQQGRSVIGNTFATKTYLNEYADTNGVIVLYPQATASSWAGGNPQGCWNWWGYGGDASYDMKGGAQIETIMRMVRALGG
ncbi:extracellular catalytic domain type 2 short-chain-length polyhydroxyalkanoate depolymerase [Actinomadura welshii]|uniref:extracellular catalytic domain type 2 short-chain-length polyhydroxyalkanoate depolymerase n=1 Tax=Actinomadura welshii TaxID=3103817 RepID=UPI0003AD2999|nr:PHB depolymerase family esterase [Actinomadura madurae]